MWDGICAVESVVAPTEPPDTDTEPAAVTLLVAPLEKELETEPEAATLSVAPAEKVLVTEPPAVTLLVAPFENELETDPDGVLEANAVVKSTVPPELAVPVTTRNALLSKFVVSFVQPVGAVVWPKNITVPDGNVSVE